MRALSLIAGMVLGVQGAHAFAAGGEDCVQSCDDDGPDGRCPPDCGDCVCCAHQPPIAAQTFVLAPPPADHLQMIGGDADRQPASADPREVQHIPKTLPG